MISGDPRVRSGVGEHALPQQLSQQVVADVEQVEPGRGREVRDARRRDRPLVARKAVEANVLRDAHDLNLLAGLDGLDDRAAELVRDLQKPVPNVCRVQQHQIELADRLIHPKRFHHVVYVGNVQGNGQHDVRQRAVDSVHRVVEAHHGPPRRGKNELFRESWWHRQ